MLIFKPMLPVDARANRRRAIMPRWQVATSGENPSRPFGPPLAREAATGFPDIALTSCLAPSWFDKLL
jgi:hypothetical protein